MSLTDLLAQLRIEYINDLPKKIIELNHFFAAKKTDDLTNAFHKIKGSGKTYGVSAVSELAAAMENICRNEPKKIESTFPLAIEVLQQIATNPEMELGGSTKWQRLQNSIQTPTTKS